MEILDLTFGIIAVAAISHRFAGAVKAAGGTVTAAASRSLPKARQFCREHSIEKAYGSYEELYRDQEIAVVYIATINAGHVKEITQALSYGKHVLCEKPLALSEWQAAGAFKLAAGKGLFLMEMQKSVFLPVTRLVKEYIDNKVLGELHQVDLSASFELPCAAWMHDPEQGGVVYGSASYTLEYLDYLIEPGDTIVRAEGTREENGTVDSVSLDMKMDSVRISSRISMRASGASYAVFYFERGWIRIPEYWKARSCEIGLSDGSIRQMEYPVDYEMVYEVEHAGRCILDGCTESPVMTVQRTLRCCCLVDEIMDGLT